MGIEGITGYPVGWVPQAVNDHHPLRGYPVLGKYREQPIL
jgi:hypothetical protein